MRTRTIAYPLATINLDGPTIDPERPLWETLLDLANWHRWLSIPPETRATLWPDWHPAHTGPRL